MHFLLQQKYDYIFTESNQISCRALQMVPSHGWDQPEMRAWIKYYCVLASNLLWDREVHVFLIFDQLSDVGQDFFIFFVAFSHYCLHLLFLGLDVRNYFEKLFPLFLFHLFQFLLFFLCLDFSRGLITFLRMEVDVISISVPVILLMCILTKEVGGKKKEEEKVNPHLHANGHWMEVDLSCAGVRKTCHLGGKKWRK